MSVFMQQDDFEAIGLSKGMREVAFEDAWARFATYDGSAREFFEAMKTECPHYFNAPAADTTEHAAFHSLSAQGAYVREHGEAATRALLATEGLTLGRIKPQAKVDAADKFKGSSNPYADNFAGSPAEREARIAALINNRDGTRLAAQLAKAAGKSITGQPLQAVGAARR
jgi:hypothetical protein